MTEKESDQLNSPFIGSGMGKTRILFFIVCVCCSAEQQYFPQHNASTWEAARKHCQLCYKELVSLTFNNIQLLVQNLTSDYWVGLRKDLSHSMFWSQWSNGDPLTFQNWYPGQPKLSEPNSQCTVSFGDFCRNINVTEQSYLEDDVCVIEIEEFCMNTTNVKSQYIPYKSVLLSNKTEEEEMVDAKNSCASLLSSGMWTEKKCTELLPYICYEDRFYGKVRVSNVTLNSTAVSWTNGPGDIDLYRVEVRGDIHLVKNTTNLTMDFSDLTPGTKYRVQVFPVKCERDLNPQNVTFYTKPDRVTNLRVSSVTIDSAFLSWDQPFGNHSFYKVTVNGHSYITQVENIQIENLSPGQNYTFIVNAEVEDRSLTGDTVSVLAYTLPDKVKELSTNGITEDAIILTWVRPKGTICCYRVHVQQEKTENIIFNTILFNTSHRVENLAAGTGFQLSVAALAGLTLYDSVEGEAVRIHNYTKPSPVTNLILESTNDSITARWNTSDGNFDFYRLSINSIETTTNKTSHTFQNLNSAFKYTVTVYKELMQKSLQSDGVSKWKFTLPIKPENLQVVNSTVNSVSLKWDVPEKLQYSSVNYSVKFTSAFWNHADRKEVHENCAMLEGLKSGTNYKFEVQTLVGNLSSEPILTSAFTESKKKTMILMVHCSSEIPLFCEERNTTDQIFKELNKIVNNKLEDHVYWRLEWRKK